MVRFPILECQGSICLETGVGTEGQVALKEHREIGMTLLIKYKDAILSCQSGNKPEPYQSRYSSCMYCMADHDARPQYPPSTTDFKLRSMAFIKYLRA